jgi:hypothetical protein
VAVRPSGQSFTLAYDRVGLKHLVGRLGKLQPKLVVVEATGGLQRQVVAALWTAGVAMAAVNRAGYGATRGVADYWRRPTASMPSYSHCLRNASNPRRGRRWMRRPRRCRNWPPGAARRGVHGESNVLTEAESDPVDWTVLLLRCQRWATPEVNRDTRLALGRTRQSRGSAQRRREATRLIDGGGRA